ncbi:hypothetical protein GOL45_08710 [Sinorhizobium medicae]|uniref:Uncharacterized protein n=3 Tax=Sinorhizobium TaxID=28105 RepID=A0ABX4TJE5_9HYPH|nr:MULTISPECIES: TrbC/VirB2 family protein [Sinorhizobium]ASP83610.1 hypothetical protein CDO26_02540 [Sinorhizobium meliloti]MBP2465911.1 hypothetical protein [Sinorhizobium meliloti]MDE3769340.1 TrbC/VirB2 family protein [Sinorhizobium meliloti]MDE3777040.1 TrbC/VirB2 family protein [Sinorhizobium meliloti]MDE3804756.1 TrbC/VirB2 family protein [Sinorhizobium meliloti]
MIALLTGPWGKWIGVAAIAVALFGVGYWKGRADIRADQLKDTIRAIEKRERIDERIQGLDGIALCNELLGGGVHDECQQLRGVEEDTRHPGRRR